MGSLLAWLIGLVISLVVSPVLGFIIYIPIVAISLLLGYMSSNVEYKVRDTAAPLTTDENTSAFLNIARCLVSCVVLD